MGPISSCGALGGSRRIYPILTRSYDPLSSCAANGGSVPIFSILARPYALLSSCAALRISLPKFPRKSDPTAPNSSCAMSQGRPDRGGGSESGSGVRSPSSTFRRRIRRAVKYSGLARLHRVSARAWRSAWQDSLEHAFCLAPIRGSGKNHRRQTQHGLLLTIRRWSPPFAHRQRVTP